MYLLFATIHYVCLSGVTCVIANYPNEFMYPTHAECISAEKNYHRQAQLTIGLVEGKDPIVKTECKKV